MRTSIILIVFLLSVSISYAQNKSVSCYKKIGVEENGEFKIIGRYKVPHEQASSQNCYHFYYENTKLIKVEYRTKGTLAMDSYYGASIIDITYDGDFERRAFFNEKHKAIPDKMYNVYSIRIKKDNKNYPISLFNYDKEGNLTKNKNGVAKYSWQVNRFGRRMLSYRFDVKGNRIYDLKGVYEVKFIYNTEGELVEGLFFDEDGEFKDCNFGYCIIKFKYNDKGFKIEESYHGKFGQHKLNTEGYAICKFELDKDGRKTRESYYSTDELLTEKTIGIASIEWAYDTDGNISKSIGYNKKGVVNYTKVAEEQ